MVIRSEPASESKPAPSLAADRPSRMIVFERAQRLQRYRDAISRRRRLLISFISIAVILMIAFVWLAASPAINQVRKPLTMWLAASHAIDQVRKPLTMWLAASHAINQVSPPPVKDLALNGEEASHTTYQVSKPLVKDLTLNDEYVCQIRAIQHIEIRSLEKGYLQDVLVDEGDTVRQGQLLFQIKPTVYQADVQKEEAEVELSKIELANNQALVEKDIISSTEAAMSAAKLAKVNAELELAKTHLGFTEIRAPFDGLIGRFGDIRLGSLLEENELLTTLSDTHRLWVYFNVPEALYLDYMENRRNGVSQNVQLELANKEIYPETGKIEVIQSDFNSTSGNIAFRARFENPHALLRYGQTGKILWPKNVNQAVIVPQKSTFEILDKRFIFVVDKTGVIHEREIKVAREAPNVYIVASGITPDEMFLLERQNKLNKGDKIRYKLVDPQSAIENLKLYAE